ncbi:hypothetical protein CFRS1_v015878 [Colletotrichum fructicola]|nr:hypothetical protein CFRS1_v015878 [Colletotrichum fructicola]
MKKLSVKESTSVFGRPSECGDRRRTRGEGGLPSPARLSSVLSDAVADADSGTDGVRNDTTGTDIRLYVLAQTDTVVRQKKLPKEHVANKH